MPSYFRSTPPPGWEYDARSPAVNIPLDKATSVDPSVGDEVRDLFKNNKTMNRKDLERMRDSMEVQFWPFKRVTASPLQFEATSPTELTHDENCPKMHCEKAACRIAAFFTRFDESEDIMCVDPTKPSTRPVPSTDSQITTRQTVTASATTAVPKQKRLDS